MVLQRALLPLTVKNSGRMRREIGGRSSCDILQQLFVILFHARLECTLAVEQKEGSSRFKGVIEHEAFEENRNRANL